VTDPARRLTASQALEHPWAAAALPDPADLTLAQANMRRAQGSGFRVRAALARAAAPAEPARFQAPSAAGSLGCFSSVNVTCKVRGCAAEGPQAQCAGGRAGAGQQGSV